jgi:hypothetical protein
MIFNMEDYARLEYARLWWNGRYRAALLRVWLNDLHPGKGRFLSRRELIVGLLESDNPEQYVRDCAPGYSLRTLIREIPVIFPDWLKQAREDLGLP